MAATAALSFRTLTLPSQDTIATGSIAPAAPGRIADPNKR